jgi:hypothetical protein
LKPRGALALAAFVVALSSVSAARANEDKWEATANVSFERTFGGDRIYDDDCAVDLSVVRGFGHNWRWIHLAAGPFVTYRDVLDVGEGVSFWYLDTGARARIDVTSRLSLRADLAASFRHIGIDGEVANTVFGLAAGAGVEVMVVDLRGWRVGATGSWRAVRTRFGESFWVDTVGLGASVTRRW